MGNGRNQEKPLVFISHDTEDEAIAKALGDLLNECSGGAVDVFFSSDRRPGGGMRAGEWFPYIKDRLSRARDIICILTPRSVNSHWILFEAGMGLGHSKGKTLHVIPLFNIPERSIPGPFSQYQWCGATFDGLKKFVTELVGRYLPSGRRDALIQEIPEKVPNFLKKIEGLKDGYREADRYAEATVLNPGQSIHFALAFEKAQTVLAYNPPLNLLVKKEKHREIIANRMRTRDFEYKIMVGAAGMARLKELVTFWATEAKDLVSGECTGEMEIKSFLSSSQTRRSAIGKLVDDSLGDNIPCELRERVRNAVVEAALHVTGEEELHTEIPSPHWIDHLSDVRGLCFFAITEESGNKVVLLYPLGAPFARTFKSPIWAILFEEQGATALMHKGFEDAFKACWDELPDGQTLPQFYKRLAQEKGRGASV